MEGDLDPPRQSKPPGRMPRLPFLLQKIKKKHGPKKVPKTQVSKWRFVSFWHETLGTSQQFSDSKGGTEKTVGVGGSAIGAQKKRARGGSFVYRKEKDVETSHDDPKKKQYRGRRQIPGPPDKAVSMTKTSTSQHNQKRIGRES